MTEVEGLVTEYLEQGRLLSFASSANEQPWVCPVWYAWDSSTHTVVYMSKQTRRHCQELSRNPRAAGSVVAIELEGLGQAVRCVNFEGIAAPAVSTRLAYWYDVYASRWPKVRELSPIESMDSASAESMWLFTVELTRAVLFDQVNFPSDPRQEIEFGPGDSPRGVSATAPRAQTEGAP